MPFTVATSVKKSSISGAGMGVFAAEPIKKGQLVWKLDKDLEIFISEEDLKKLSSATETRLRELVFYSKQYQTYILCSDNACYMNHRDKPNCDDPDDDTTYANRDIAVGEELTVDYRAYDEPGYANVVRATKGKPGKRDRDESVSESPDMAPRVRVAEKLIALGDKFTSLDQLDEASGHEPTLVQDVLKLFRVLGLVHPSMLKWCGGDGSALQTFVFGIVPELQFQPHAHPSHDSVATVNAAGSITSLAVICRVLVRHFMRQAILQPHRGLQVSDLMATATSAGADSSKPATVRMVQELADILVLLNLVSKTGNYYRWAGVSSSIVENK